MTRLPCDQRGGRDALPAGTATACWWFVLLLVSLSMPAVQAVEFIRGDANGDGQVSVADASFIAAFLFRGRAAPACLASADIDNDGGVSLTDTVGLLNYLAAEGAAPVSPFPTAGPDVPSEALEPLNGFGDLCDSYGDGTPLVDPAARLSLLEVIAEGGDDNRVRVRIALSSSGPIGGYAGTLRAPPSLFYPLVKGALTDLSGTQLTEPHQRPLAMASSTGVTADFAFLTSISEEAPIPASENLVVAEVVLYAQVDTPAGSYNLTLESGELVDAESGRAIAPELAGAQIVLATDVTGDARPDLTVVPIPENFDFSFVLGDAEGFRGQPVEVPFFVLSNGAVNGYVASVDFDESALELNEIERVWQRSDGEDFAFSVFEYNNDDNSPGSSGLSEGFAIAAAVFDFELPIAIPPNTDTEVVRFHFTIKPTAPIVAAGVAFVDGAQGSGEPVHNSGAVSGQTFTPDLANSFVFVNAQVNVLPEVTLFRRGDSNADAVVDLSDAQTTINFLFLGGQPPACRDAADANDDGELDVSDPLAILNHLFFSAGALPPPSPELGIDPTGDELTCLAGTRSS